MKKKTNYLFFPKKSKRRKRSILKKFKSKRDQINKLDNIFINSGTRVKKAFITFFLFLVILAGLFFVFFSNFFAIQFIEVTREDVYIDNNKVKTHLNRYFGKNILFVSTQTLKEQIKNAFPIISTINIQRQFPNTLIIDVKSYPSAANVKIKIDPNLLIQIETGSTIESINFIEQKVIINSKGFVTNIEKENLQLPIIYLADQKTEVKLYEKIIPSKHLYSILETLNTIENVLNFKVKDITYYQHGQEMHFKTEKGFVLWLDFQDSPENQINKLKKVIGKFDLENNPPRYFDLRIKNRLIYK